MILIVITKIYKAVGNMHDDIKRLRILGKKKIKTLYDLNLQFMKDVFQKTV